MRADIQSLQPSDYFNKIGPKLPFDDPAYCCNAKQQSGLVGQEDPRPANSNQTPSRLFSESGRAHNVVLATLSA